MEYIYEVSLGAFDTGVFEDSVGLGYVWILFLLCTVLNMIIMLNLLIAIISESFARIQSVSEQAAYQEEAAIIAENSYLIPRKKQKKLCKSNTYLLLALDAEQELKEREIGDS